MKHVLVAVGKNIKNAVVLKMKMFFLTIALSLVCLVLSFPPFHFWFLIWLALIPFFYALSLSKTYRSSFFLAWLMGFLFFTSTVWWVGNVTIIGAFLLYVYLGVFWGFFGWMFFHTRFWHRTRRLLFLSALWVLLEWLRGHGSTFEGMFLGNSQALNFYFLQVVDIGGAWGLSFLIFSVNYIIFEMIKTYFQDHCSWKSIVHQFKRPLITFLIVLIFIFCYGYWKVHFIPKRDYIQVGVVQANIPLEVTWARSLNSEIVNRHLELSELFPLHSIDLFIWPETAFPHFYWQYPDLMKKVKDFVISRKTPLLLGTVTRRQNQYFNSALLLDGFFGKKQAQYDKRSLVMFGEYLPLRKTFSFLERFVPIDDFTSGEPQQDFLVLDKKWPFSVLICFEEILSLLAAQDTRRGALFFVSISNYAWFGKSSAADLQLFHAVFRAVENRRSFVRSTNTGVSCVITPEGRIQDVIENQQGEKTMISGHKIMQVPIETKKTFFTKFPWAFTFLCFLVILLAYEKQKNF